MDWGFIDASTAYRRQCDETSPKLFLVGLLLVKRVDVIEPAHSDEYTRPELEAIRWFNQVVVHTYVKSLVDFLETVHCAEDYNVNVRQHKAPANLLRQLQTCPAIIKSAVGNNDSGRGLLKRLPQIRSGGKRPYI